MWLVVCHKESPKSAIVVTKGCSPLPTAIDRTLLHVVARSILYLIKEIGHCLPMHEVGTSHNRTAREDMHGGSDQIIIVTHTDNIWVRGICPDEWIFYLNRLS